MTAIALVYSLFASVEQAQAMAGTVIEERLAACANILAPCTSIYAWQDALEQAVEIPVLFKTAAHRRDALMARIAELHDYDVPAILAWPVDAALPPFAAWVEGQTR